MTKTLTKFGGVPAGGSTGQALVKTSGSDHAVGWSDVSGGSSLNQRRFNPVRALGTSNISLTGVTTVDGLTLNAGDRVCLNGQTDQTENGIYEFNGSDLVRADDFQVGKNVGGGDFYVMYGTYFQTLWAFVNVSSIVGTDNIGALKLGTLPTGGSEGQALRKVSGGDYDVTWGSADGTAPPFALRQNYYGGGGGSGFFLYSTGPDYIYMDKRDSGGNDWSGLLSQVAPGWFVEVYKPTNAGGVFAVLQVTSVALSGDTFQFTGTWIASNGSISGTGGDFIIALNAKGSTINGLANATANGSLENTQYVLAWNWSEAKSGGAAENVEVFKLSLDSVPVFTLRYNGGTLVGIPAYSVVIGDAYSSGGTIQLQTSNLYLDAAVGIRLGNPSAPILNLNVTGSQIAVFNASGSGQASVSAAPTGTIMDGAIAGLSFSDPVTQAEAQALRDYCEQLRDWLEEVATAVNAQRTAMQTFGWYAP